jgi:hypothetical protein
VTPGIRGLAAGRQAVHAAAREIFPAGTAAPPPRPRALQQTRLPGPPTRTRKPPLRAPRCRVMTGTSRPGAGLRRKVRTAVQGLHRSRRPGSVAGESPRPTLCDPAHIRRHPMALSRPNLPPAPADWFQFVNNVVQFAPIRAIGAPVETIPTKNRINAIRMLAPNIPL